VKSKFISPVFFAFVIAISICGNSNQASAQTTASDQKPLEIKNAFFGRWADVKDPNHLLEIYKENSFIIVQRRTELNDGSPSKKYSVITANGNKLKVDVGSGLSPLTITDDGAKISFLGNEYSKK
jgi:hypothetical protein